MRTGIDVSRWQKGFNLQSAKNEGFEVVIIKAGGADSGRYKDSQFENFYQQAKNINMITGAYYFGQAFSVADAQAEAKHFISLLQGKDIKNVFYDVEGKMLNQGRQHLTDIIKAFVTTVNAAGYTCGIYSSEWYYNNGIYDNQLMDYIHWVAKYSSKAPTLKSGHSLDLWQYGGEVNYIRSNKIAGTVIDQDYVYIDFGKETIVVTDNIWTKSISQLAQEVLEGKYGNGQDRKNNLGARYAEVQAEVERLLKAQSKPQKANEKTIDQLAVEVLAGKYGSGAIRRAKLIALVGVKMASQVQQRVDEIIAERKSTGKQYVVQKGDTLTKIARNYNTTVDALVKANNISNPNLIKVGQTLIIK